MKKFLQTLAIALPLLGFSQLFTFNSSLEGWSVTGGSFTFNHDPINGVAVLNGAGLTPSFMNIVSSTTMDATNNKKVRIRMKVGDPAVANIRVSTYTAPSTFGNLSNTLTQTFNTTDYIDYIIPLNNAAWTGTPLAAVRFNKTATNWGTADILIDEIEFANDFFKYDFPFNVVDDYWTPENTTTNGGTIALVAGSLVLTPTGGKNAKISSVYSIDGTNYKYVHVLYKNNSTNNDRLRLLFRNSADNYAANKTLTPDQIIVTGGNSGEAIFDATTNTDWSGTLRNIGIVLTSSVATTSVDASTLEIDRIVINNSSASLSTNDIANSKKSLTIYPNPVSDVLNINAASKISSAKVFNMAGQVVKTFNSTKQINVSGLAKGNYVVKVKLEDGTESVSKFIKK